MKKLKVAIGQAGGPTAVINASLAGFVAEAAQSHEVFGVMCGFQGLCENRFVHLDREMYSNVMQHRTVPGACLGSGRWPLTDEMFRQAIGNLRLHDIHLLAMIGGNGTMQACRKLELAAAEMNYELAVVGIPKTVDNDILHTDHSPGFGSAARYVATAVRDIGRDLQAMRNFESVRIIETMGRHVGWLAGAGGLLKTRPEESPHLLYVPERPFELTAFLRDVEDVVRNIGHAVVVVSEGVRDNQGQVMSEVKLQRGRQVLGGVGSFLAEQVSEQLGYASRAEMLGMSQRCFAQCVSGLDRLEAEQVGQRAAKRLLNGEGSIMLNLLRVSAAHEPYACEIGGVALSDTAFGERAIPESLLSATPHASIAVNESFHEWLKPLVGKSIRAYPSSPFANR